MPCLTSLKEVILTTCLKLTAATVGRQGWDLLAKLHGRIMSFSLQRSKKPYNKVPGVNTESWKYSTVIMRTSTG